MYNKSYAASDYAYAINYAYASFNMGLKIA
jgi:hypothetical protein